MVRRFSGAALSRQTTENARKGGGEAVTAKRTLPEGALKFADQLLGKVRRFFLVKFRPDYVRKSIARRRGQCRRCGRCCSLAFRCPHLKEGNQCAIYANRYEQCALFPIDERDLKYLKDTCGHYYGNGKR